MSTQHSAVFNQFTIQSEYWMYQSDFFYNPFMKFQPNRLVNNKGPY